MTEIGSACSKGNFISSTVPAPRGGFARHYIFRGCDLHVERDNFVFGIQGKTGTCFGMNIWKVDSGFDSPAVGFTGMSSDPSSQWSLTLRALRALRAADAEEESYTPFASFSFDGVLGLALDSMAQAGNQKALELPELSVQLCG